MSLRPNGHLQWPTCPLKTLGSDQETVHILSGGIMALVLTWKMSQILRGKLIWLSHKWHAGQWLRTFMSLKALTLMRWKHCQYSRNYQYVAPEATKAFTVVSTSREYNHWGPQEDKWENPPFKKSFQFAIITCVLAGVVGAQRSPFNQLQGS